MAVFLRSADCPARRPCKEATSVIKTTAFVRLLPLCTALLCSAAVGQTLEQPLPDWSGVWQMIGSTVFDAATVEPRNGRSGNPGVREHPPYNAEWEAKYLANIESVRQGRFPDPLTYCGIPAGFPRLLNVPDVYEFVVRPEQVWILTENGPNIMRIYTDGREHPAEGDYWPTYSGDSVGHWEDDTLVVDTIGLKSDGDTILDRTGLVLSEAMHIVTRIRKLDEQTLEARLVIEDPIALTAPWAVVKRY